MITDEKLEDIIAWLAIDVLPGVTIWVCAGAIIYFGMHLVVWAARGFSV